MVLKYFYNIIGLVHDDYKENILTRTDVFRIYKIVRQISQYILTLKSPGRYNNNEYSNSDLRSLISLR